jgi:hypothetical protein
MPFVRPLWLSPLVGIVGLSAIVCIMVANPKVATYSGMEHLKKSFFDVLSLPAQTMTF